MQTFLPDRDYAVSAAVLDNRRLGKQILECYQLMLANCPNQHGRVIKLFNRGCTNKTVVNLATHADYNPPYRNHPCALMWRGHDVSLLIYAIAMHREWRRRGFNSYRETLDKMKVLCDRAQRSVPLWHTREDVYASHRSNLLRKDLSHYSQFRRSEPSNLEYVWPV